MVACFFFFHLPSCPCSITPCSAFHSTSLNSVSCHWPQCSTSCSFYGNTCQQPRQVTDADSFFPVSIIPAPGGMVEVMQEAILDRAQRRELSRLGSCSSQLKDPTKSLQHRKKADKSSGRRRHVNFARTRRGQFSRRCRITSMCSRSSPVRTSKNSSKKKIDVEKRSILALPEAFKCFVKADSELQTKI